VKCRITNGSSAGENDMSNFTRCLKQPALASLHRLTKESGQNRWKDLLTLWKPSGSAAGTNGLRLAIRNNYLNFYARGQSLARVRFNPAHEPYVETHVKYVFDADEETQAYARLQGTIIQHPKSKAQLNYKGQSTLHEWIERAAKHTGIEKQCVDDLVENNPAIIDLEMGLPAFGERKTAQRMDCVALEKDADVLRIVFWEAKMIDDPRLVSRSDPKVIKQVKIYREYLSDSGRARSVEIAYGRVCGLLQEIGAMAAAIGVELKLDQLILEAAREGANLEVDLEPRLVILGDKGHRKKGDFLIHRDKLWKSFGIPNIVFEEGPYALRQPAMIH
jgi:hypothetical protein